ncbi:ABC transporter family substrate-binding protein [Kibdelosporangium persicum]|uniref:Periplasmic substrate-binding component of ABC-type oligopeptide/dipeptide transport system n=1 Tax=Kibdelosporangium persicum TaxID=2698649 RepID=A0ABX2F8U7_9PSEU|nr:ABC transporter family substrate-binding protein [Kibdelosporangium persicum]NRN67737.1 Periplasmic substrate-binding component of ABC-type oligopeptide/dipeptide transport system [Kibdelosporangium persicum]
MAAAVVAALVMLTACSNTPPPPVVGTVPPVPSASAAKPGEIVVGVDSIAGGYNPHVLADQSTITTALSTMLLPSVFRTAPDGSPQLDRTLMVSADVTRTEPYTVTYRLRGDAAWSDGAPIAAEDFLYLREQMRDEPGGVDSAGYRLITDIKSEESGKVVQVTFAAPYPGWRSLFTSLLPAHLLKDAPGGWDQVLESTFPATAGPFSIKQLDAPRGEIVLERNERYWERPAVADRVILRRADPAGLSDALRTGHDQLVVARTDAGGVAMLQALGDKVTVKAAPRPAVVSLFLRPAGTDLADDRVRTALVNLLDRDEVIRVGTGGGPSVRADALVLAPSQAGYGPTGPLAHDPAAAQSLLTQAGYSLVSGVWTREGRPLVVTLGAPADKEPYVLVAKEVQRQLVAAGVQVKLVTPAGDQLMRSSGTEAGPNILIAPRPVGDSPAAVMASVYGCPVRSTDATQAPPGNLAGFCDQSLQPTIDAALNGSMALAEAIGIVEPRLWRQAVAVPLFQSADSVAARAELSTGDLTAPLNAPFASAVSWQRKQN